MKGYWHDWDSTYTTIRNQLANGGAGPGIAGQVTTDLNTYWGFEDKGINALAKLTPGGPFEYLVGYDFQQYSGKDDVLLIAEQEEDVHAVFGQLRSTDDLIKNGSFAIGVASQRRHGSSITVWNASGRYDFTPWLYAQANVGTSFLLPTAEQLYAIDPFSTLGNPNLEAEEAENLNIGFGGDLDVGPALSLAGDLLHARHRQPHPVRRLRRARTPPPIAPRSIPIARSLLLQRRLLPQPARHG